MNAKTTRTRNPSMSKQDKQYVIDDLTKTFSQLMGTDNAAKLAMKIAPVLCRNIVANTSYLNDMELKFDDEKFELGKLLLERFHVDDAS